MSSLRPVCCRSPSCIRIRIRTMHVICSGIIIIIARFRSLCAERVFADDFVYIRVYIAVWYTHTPHIVLLYSLPSIPSERGADFTIFSSGSRRKRIIFGVGIFRKTTCARTKIRVWYVYAVVDILCITCRYRDPYSDPVCVCVKIETMVPRYTGGG